MIPYIVETDTLEAWRQRSDSVVVHVGAAEDYQTNRIPGALFLDIKTLNAGDAPVTGLLPEIETLQRDLGAIGYRPDLHIIAYDNKMGQQAARLCWVLAALGHSRVSWLNGGLRVWMNQRRPTTNGIGDPVELTQPALNIDHSVISHEEDIRNALQDESIQILDARSIEEFRGEKSVSDRKGHIPGALHLDWRDTIVSPEQPVLKTPQQLWQLTDSISLNPDLPVITHCQTHQRSSHMFVVLKSLGFKNVSGYPGSWAQWSLSADNPIVNLFGAAG
ncbi:MAG: rhodanese-like domain-containing protein [Pseudomonadota bacterium]